MPNDAFMVSAIAKELGTALQKGKINKVLQPEADEINLVVYNGGVFRLLLSACPEYPRVHLTSAVKENPAQPYQFCMSLRKHLTGGEITSVTAAKYDRVVTICVLNTTELKDVTEYKLIIEIMGRQSNIILCSGDFNVISVLKPVSLDSSSKRSLISGIKYEYPENPKVKINDTVKAREFLSGFDGDDLCGFIAGSFSGFSKTTAEHIIKSAGLSNKILGSGDTERLLAEFGNFDKLVNCGVYRPCVVTKNGEPADFFIYPYSEEGNYSFFDTCSEAADYFYGERDKCRRLKEKKKNLLSSLKNAVDRNRKKLAILNDKLKECADMESFRKSGELLTANLYKIKGREKSISVEDYYNGGKETVIPLDENLSPSKNAQRYYKKYNKLKSAKQVTEGLAKETANQLDYLLSIEGFLDAAGSTEDISEIAEELKNAGIAAKSGAAPKKKDSKPNIYITKADGYTLYCGKNNLQNDYVTFKIAKPSDLWFHVKGFHGSHVVLTSADGKYTDSAVLYAARLAAKMSEAKGSEKAAVDYTLKKYVKKPNGAKPGFVIYTDYKSILVNLQ